MWTKTGKLALKSPFQGGNEFGASRRTGGCVISCNQALMLVVIVVRASSGEDYSIDN